MATPRRQFNLIQGGTVNAWDGGTVATMRFAGCTEIRWRPANVVQTTDTLRGSLIMADGADVLGLQGEAVMVKLLSYEDVPYVLESAYGHASPTVQGTAVGGTAYKRVYGPAGTVEDAPVLRRLEVANNVLAGYIPTALPSSFEITGQPRQFTTCTENWWGSQYVAGTVTAGISKRTVERVKAGNFAFYLDNQAGGTIGTTVVTDCITGFRFQSGNLWIAKNCLSGSLISTGFAEQPQQAQLDLTVQLGTLSEALKADYQAGNGKYVQMVAHGGTIGTAGTVTKSFQIDMTAQIMAWPEEGQNEAENGEVVTITFTEIDDTSGTFGKAIQYTSVNAVSALP
jgi:hypothetical protein